MVIHLNSTLRGQAGIRMIEVDWPAGATVREVLAQAIDDYPVLRPILTDSQGALRGDLLIFRNGRNTRFEQGMDTALAHGDKLDLFPMTGVQRAFASETYL